MNVAEIVEQARIALTDIKEPFLWSTPEILVCASEAERRMCRRARRLIKDSDTIGEVLASGTITLAGIAGQITALKVNGLAIITGPIPFNATIGQTATDLATAINVFSYAATYYGVKYTAQAVGAVVTITAQAGSGATPNGHIIPLRVPEASRQRSLPYPEVLRFA